MPSDALESPVPAGDVSAPAWRIEPWNGGLRPRLREIWAYRRLTMFFALKSLQKQYARTKLGWAWLFIRPLFPLLAKALVFGGVLAVKSEHVPYFVLLVTASAVWELFASAVMWGTRSLELNRGLLKQLYVPRLILPLSMMSPAFFTFVIHLAVLLAAVIWYRVADGRYYVTVGAHNWWAVLACAMAVLLAVAIAFWTSVPALSARDVRLTLGYGVGIWVLLTPVMYPLSAVPESWQFWMMLNPMAPIVELFKYGVLGVGTPPHVPLGISAAIIVLVASTGLAFFVRKEADAADRV